MTLLVIDNYDSFTYNLVQLAGELGAAPVVYRNDALTVPAAMDLHPTAILLSPGPGVPRDAGICIPLILAAAEARIPLLGVCLGHQAIGEAYGGAVVSADRLMHGKTTRISHNGEGLFAGLESPLEVMRYHSLIVAKQGLPASIEVTAWSADRGPGEEVMAIRHREYPIHGVQFHPESIATSCGGMLLENFLQLAR